jgi:hypothetical protein
MNHLEQLASEWLEYNNYIVRTSVLVGPRPGGGHEGELDVVGFNFVTRHLVHVECSLDADSWTEREKRFQQKFQRGRTYIGTVFRGLDVSGVAPDQILLHQFVTNIPSDRHIGGRLVTVRSLIHEIYHGLRETTPARGAVPSNFPLLRTLQVAKDAEGGALAPEGDRLIRASQMG